MTDGYLAFLLARDGEADLLRHTLSRREAFFDRLHGSPSARGGRSTARRSSGTSRAAGPSPGSTTACSGCSPPPRRTRRNGSGSA